MKTTSIIAISTFVASTVFSGVNGQMVPLQGTDGNPAPVKGLTPPAQPAKQDIPAPKHMEGSPKPMQDSPKPMQDSPKPMQDSPKPMQDSPKPMQDSPKFKQGSRKQVAQKEPAHLGRLSPPAPEVVHITKTRTEIVYPTPNPRLWKYLPEFPAHGPQGKIVAEFKVDDEGHFHKYGKHGGWNHQKGGRPNEYHRLAYKGEGGYQHNGYHHNGEVYYEGGNEWAGKKGDHKHKGGKEDHQRHHDEEGKGHKGKKGDKHGKEDTDMKKKTDHPRHGKGDQDLGQKKKMNDAQPNQVDGFISAQSVNGTEASNVPAVAAASPSGIPKNAAASSSSSSSAASSASSSSAKPSSSTSTSASSNTHQVAVSFVAMMATVAAWCLA